jgi:hypothetical protein
MYQLSSHLLHLPYILPPPFSLVTTRWWTDVIMDVVMRLEGWDEMREKKDEWKKDDVGWKENFSFSFDITCSLADIADIAALQTSQTFSSYLL